jgi:hypothetical protein
MEKKIFQSGGPIIDGWIVWRRVCCSRQEPVSGGALDGELVEEQIILRKILQKLLTLNLQDMWVLTLQSGAVLTAYGVQGGVITYEDGSSARFQNLILLSRRILSSLVSESVLIEEKYNLDEDEVNFSYTAR